MLKRKREIEDESDSDDSSSSSTSSTNTTISDTFLDIARKLNVELDKLNFINQIDYVYNPAQYAYSCYKNYTEKYCNTTKDVMFLGMNPGPFGMSQTGVPFGEVDIVRDWLKIEGDIGKPEKELSSRPVLGFDCKRHEISGLRFWGLMKELCKEPEVFFHNCFVYNYLPLQFLKRSGKNITPAELQARDRDELFKVCDKSFIEVIKLYELKVIVAVGKFAEARAKAAIKRINNCNIKVVTILHPSPLNRKSNKWNEEAYKQLEELGIIHYLRRQEN